MTRIEMEEMETQALIQKWRVYLRAVDAWVEAKQTLAEAELDLLDFHIELDVEKICSPS